MVAPSGLWRNQRFTGISAASSFALSVGRSSRKLRRRNGTPAGSPHHELDRASFQVTSKVADMTSTTTTITTNEVLTLINTFTVKPENQQTVIDMLNEATEQVMRHFPGFISANIHRGVDRTKVANYAQWESMEYYQAMMKEGNAREHMSKVAGMVESFEPLYYEVDHVCHKN